MSERGGFLAVNLDRVFLGDIGGQLQGNLAFGRDCRGDNCLLAAVEDFGSLRTLDAAVPALGDVCSFLGIAVNSIQGTLNVA